jgi:hypothetical protein
MTCSPMKKKRKTRKRTMVLAERRRLKNCALRVR